MEELDSLSEVVEGSDAVSFDPELQLSCVNAARANSSNTMGKKRILFQLIGKIITPCIDPLCKSIVPRTSV